MADRDLTRNGVQVDFFGEPTRLPAGPAKLAIRTGAALFPVHSWYEARRLGLRVYPELDTSSGDVAAITQALADRFADEHRRASGGLAHDAAAVVGRPVRRAQGPP